MPNMYANEADEDMAVSNTPDLHGMLEDVKRIDSKIAELHEAKDRTLREFYTEREKLDAHHEMVVNKPMADPGPTTGRY